MLQGVIGFTMWRDRHNITDTRPGTPFLTRTRGTSLSRVMQLGAELELEIEGRLRGGGAVLSDGGRVEVNVACWRRVVEKEGAESVSSVPIIA